MKFLHLADLHLGRRLCDAPLLEDQRHILGEILEIARRESVDAVLIAGDVYDKPVPPVEAVALLVEFLTALSQLGAVSCKFQSFPCLIGFSAAALASPLKFYCNPVMIIAAVAIVHDQHSNRQLLSFFFSGSIFLSGSFCCPSHFCNGIIGQLLNTVLQGRNHFSRAGPFIFFQSKLF